MGVVECLNHKLVEPFNVLYEKEGERERHEHILLHQLPCRALYNYVSLLPFAWLFLFLFFFVLVCVFVCVCRGICCSVQIYGVADAQWPTKVLKYHAVCCLILRLI